MATQKSMTIAIAERRLQAVLQAGKVPERLSSPSATRSFPEPIPVEVAEQEDDPIKPILVVIAIGSLLLSPFVPFVSSYILMVTIPSFLVFGGWYYVLWYNSPKQLELRRRKRRARTARANLVEVESELRTAYQLSTDKRLRQTVHVAKRIEDFKAVGRARSATLEQRTARERSQRYNTHMRSYTIRNAVIPGIGPERKAALQGRGITCAEDIERSAVLEIRGFKEELLRVLLDWKDGIHSSFQFDPTSALTTDEYRRIVAPFEARQDECRVEIDAILDELELPDAELAHCVRRITPSQRDAARACDRAEADLTFFRKNA